MTAGAHVPTRRVRVARAARGIADRLDGLTPVHEVRSPAARLRRARAAAVLALFELNDLCIRRWAPPTPVWDTARFPWVSALEAATADIRAELDAHLAGHVPPTTAQLNGLESAAGDPTDGLPGVDGTWRVLLLSTFGRPVPANAAAFPATLRAVAGAPAAANVGFSVLEAGASIGLHRDPNRGALRVHLPVVVPEGPGRCEIEVDGTAVEWHEGKVVVFDLADEHLARNERSGPRVVLAFEIPRPLPAPLRPLNAAAQHAYRWFPPFRGMEDRAVPAPGTSDTAAR